MSNIHDSAKKFADELKNVEEVIAYREATKKINENEEASQLVVDFRTIQYKAYTEQVQSGQVTTETQKEMEVIGQRILENKEVSEYINSEAKFVSVWQDILNLLDEAIGVKVIAPRK